MTLYFVWCVLPVVFEVMPLDIMIFGQCLQFFFSHLLLCGLDSGFGSGSVPSFLDVSSIGVGW